MPNPFTHKKLTDVKDSAPDFGLSEQGEARFAKDDFEGEDTGFTHLRIKPNKRQPFGHRHEHAEEVYVVIAGAGRMKLDDEVIDIEWLDAIRVSPEVTRAFEADSEGLELIAFGPRRDGDGEVIPNWWDESE